MQSSIMRCSSVLNDRTSCLSNSSRLTFPQHSPRCRQTVAVYRGNNGGYGSSTGGSDSRRLIIPGRSDPPPSRGGGGRIIIPGQEGSKQQQQPVQDGVGTSSPVPGGGFGGRGFRPPAGFMEETTSDITEEEMDPQALLNVLQAESAPWHVLATYLPKLTRANFGPSEVEAITGVERSLQNIWAVAQQVYSSLKKSGAIPESKLAYFDKQGAEHLLYEIRFLAAEHRPALAAYIADNRVDLADCVVLARSVREHLRRKGEAEGFAFTPADCLAFKYYRDALECKTVEDRLAAMEKGLKVAETDGARAKLRTLDSASQEAAAAASGDPPLPVSQAKLTMLRLTNDELGWRPLPLVGKLGGTSAEAVRAAPYASTSGLFGEFTLSGGEVEKWVAVPAWNLVLLALRPIALMISDCSKVDAVVATMRAGTDEDKKRLVGPGLLVVERKSLPPEVDSYYLVATSDGGVEVADGERAAAEQLDVIGRVLLVCRPPQQTSMLSDTSHVVQL